MAGKASEEWVASALIHSYHPAAAELHFGPHIRAGRRGVSNNPAVGCTYQYLKSSHYKPWLFFRVCVWLQGKQRWCRATVWRLNWLGWPGRHLFGGR